MTIPRSAVVLWVMSPLLLALAWYRPFTASAGRAERLPKALDGYAMAAQHPMTARHFELLGTNDAVWRTYRDERKTEIYVVALFHQENWKSVHPPRICLEGSDMSILDEGELPLGPGPNEATVGRILTKSRSSGQDYVSLFVYGAPGFLTSGYTEFFLHHAPRAILRQSTGGFLLRVESFVGPEGVRGAETLCLDFVRKILPSAQALVDS